MKQTLIETLVAAPTAVSLADDVALTDFAQSHVVMGRAAVTASLRAFFVEGFPGANLETTASLIDNRAAMMAGVLNGRQQGQIGGIPRTGRQVPIPFVIVCHTAQEIIQRIELYYDAGRLLRQLGLAL